MFSKKKYRCILSTALALGLLTTLAAGCSGEPVSPSSTLSTPNSNATQTQISSRTPIASQTKSVSPGITHSSATGSASHPSAATYSVGSPTVPSTTKGDTTPSVTLPQENVWDFPKIPADALGNHQSNALWRAAFAETEAYYFLHWNYQAIWRIDKRSGTAKAIVEGVNSTFGIHAIGKWLVYTDEVWDDTGGHLYIVRCDTDGRKKQILGESGLQGVRVYGPWIYTYNSGSLVRIHLDGKQKEILYTIPKNLSPGHYLAVERDTVYFFASNSTTQKMDLCAVSISTRKLTTLRSFEQRTEAPGDPYDENFHDKDLFYSYGDSFYTAKFFYDKSDDGRVKTDILRLSRDGSQMGVAATLNTGLNTYRLLTFHNGYFYYKGAGIRAFSLDHPEDVKLLADSFGEELYFIGLSDEWVFFMYDTRTDGQKIRRLARVRLDGTGREDISSVPEIHLPR